MAKSEDGSEHEADVTTADPNYLLIVSGLPRSGTSLAMQMLHRGGIRTQIDGVRAADLHNPFGYFEHTAPRSLLASEGSQLQLAGTAIKITFPEILEVRFFVNTRIIFLCRDLREVLDSQRRILATSVSHGKSEFEYWTHYLQTGLAYLQSGGDRVQLLKLQHRLIIEDTATATRQLSQFLPGVLNTSAMTTAVDPLLYRSRVSCLVADSQNL